MREDQQFLCEQVDQKKEEYCKLSDGIWRAAELKFKEKESADLLCKMLEQEGFLVERGIAGMETAFRASFGEGEPRVAFLGEYDALASLSQKECSAEREAVVPDGNGHGCGHNLLGVATAASAVAVKNLLQKEKRTGTVVYFGCPGEEGGSGKAFMARAGVFDDMDVAFCWHPGDANFVRSTSSYANIQVAFQFTGKAAHAAAVPHLGRSALDAVELMNVGVNFLREHVPVETRMHYAITNAGGVSPNVVQPYAEVLYLLRAPKIGEVQPIYERVCNIAEGAALMTETKLKVVFQKACSELVMNDALGEALYRNLLAVGAHQPSEAEISFAKEIQATFSEEEFTQRGVASKRGAGCTEKTPEYQVMLHDPIHSGVLPFHPAVGSSPGSTDVGDCSQVVPTAQIYTATGALGTPGHTWQMTAQGTSTLAHENMLYAAKVIACTGWDAMTDPELIQRAKKEYTERMGETGYQCIIPPEVQPKPY